MTEDKKRQIAESFSDIYAESKLNLRITKTEFGKFEKGIYAGSMDEKWNIFVINDFMYWARSWTDKCIYKIGFEKNFFGVKLTKIMVTRNQNQYKSTDLNADIDLFKRMLNFYLKEK